MHVFRHLSSDWQGRMEKKGHQDCNPIYLSYILKSFLEYKNKWYGGACIARQSAYIPENKKIKQNICVRLTRQYDRTGRCNF